MYSVAVQRLIQQISKFPGLGPRSGRRIALHLMQNKQAALDPFMSSLVEVANTVKFCRDCGNLDTSEVCTICTSEKRDKNTICVVAGVDDVWAMERAGVYNGLYHVLGGVLSALDGVGPSQLRLQPLQQRVSCYPPREVIIALSATLEGQTTAYYVVDLLRPHNIENITRLAHGVPVGGELDYLDEGTISAALQSRQVFAL